MRTGFDGRYPEDAWEAVRGTAAAPESLSGLLLLEKGADVNAAASDGSTALSLAKAKGHTAIVDMLRAAGAKE